MAATKVQKVLNEAEAVIDVKATEVEAELTSIALSLPALKQAVEDAEDEVGPVSEVWKRIRSGEDVPPSDLVEAEAQEKIDKRRLDYLTARQATLERSLPVDTLVLAERTAAVLRRVMQGFEVYVTRAAGGTWQFPKGTTAIVVVAEGPIQRDPYTGLVSGGVTVLMHRPGQYRPINVQAFEAAAKRERLFLDVTSNQVGDEGGWQTITGPTSEAYDPNAFVIDRLTVRLHSVIDSYAVIPQVDLSGLHSRTWVEEVYRSNGAHPTGLPGTDKPWHWAVSIGRHTVATGHDPEVVSETVNEDGVRTLVVKQVVNTFNTQAGDFCEGLSEAMRLDHGTTYLGLGVLTESEVRSGSAVAEPGAANWTLVMTFESKVA